MKRHFNQHTKVYHRSGLGREWEWAWVRFWDWYWEEEWLAASPDSGFGRVFADFIEYFFFFGFCSDLPHFLFVASKMFSHQLGPEKIFSGHLARFCDLFDAFRHVA